MNPADGTRPARLGTMLAGLAVTSTGLVLMTEADLGVTPWEALTAGAALQTGVPVGWVRLLVLLVVAAALVALRVRLQTGTVLVVAAYPAMVVLAQSLLPDLSSQALALVAGVVLMGVGGGLYLAPAVGAAPTDLLVGEAARRARRPLWSMRIGVESAALALGWAMGKAPGPGTLLFAVAVGPVVSITLLLIAGRVVRRPTGRIGGGGFVPAPVDARWLRRAGQRLGLVGVR